MQGYFHFCIAVSTWISPNVINKVTSFLTISSLASLFFACLFSTFSHYPISLLKTSSSTPLYFLVLQPSFPYHPFLLQMTPQTTVFLISTAVLAHLFGRTPLILHRMVYLNACLHKDRTCCFLAFLQPRQIVLNLLANLPKKFSSALSKSWVGMKGVGGDMMIRIEGTNSSNTGK